MSDSGPSLDPLDMLWTRVADAKLQLDLARSYVKEVKGDLQSGCIPGTDGQLAYTRALRLERVALERYLAALESFHGGLSVDSKRSQDSPPR